jgi:hypothetical protein
MPEPVYRMMTLLSTLTTALSMGTNLGLLHVLWMLVSGQLLTMRGAVIPGLALMACRCGAHGAARLGRARTGGLEQHHVLRAWERLVAAVGHWQASCQGGDHPLAVDVTAFWRPRLSHHPLSCRGRQGAARHPARPRRTRRRGWCTAAGRAHNARARRAGRSPSARTGASAGARRRAAVRAARRPGARCRVRRGAAAGGRCRPLRRASGQEQHLSPGQSPSVPWTGTAANARGGGAALGTALQEVPARRRPRTR